ncbi:MAG: hypothetical protein C0600_12190 [Ignavibacteria bacterium]|nr:MAG: hypothetical protein C0600_12190 [Ignavibacteria bacterium]
MKNLPDLLVATCIALIIQFVNPAISLRAQDHPALPSEAAAEAAAIQQLPDEDDPCGFRLTRPAETKEWGYPFAALISDMQRWALHPWVQFEGIGESVENRPLHHMVLTNPASTQRKRRLWIHARTHPIESESSLVARALVDELLSGSELSRRVLDHCIVHVLPMFNPDGVVLQYARENANGIDLESNWGSASPEAEVQALRSQFIRLMDSEQPIDIALNLHSAFTCKRYFVYHAEAGTSELFTQQEQRFISAVRGYFPGGIEPFDFFVSWTSGTPDRYPESWFWNNYRERVMALTYEDMNCSTAGEFDKTARALLGGAADYLGLGEVSSVTALPARETSLSFDAVFPQPLRPGQALQVRMQAAKDYPGVEIGVFDLLGRRVAKLWNGALQEGRRLLILPSGSMAPGSYLLRAESHEEIVQYVFVVL